MGYKRLRDKTIAKEHWHAFVGNHGGLIQKTGLPGELFDAIDRWDEFLNGGAGAVERLTEGQYAALVQLAESYFAQGYEYFRPSVLRRETQEWFDVRFLT